MCRLLLGTNARVENIEDGERAYASQTIMLNEALTNEVNGRLARALNVANTDRFSVLINSTTKEVHVVPKDHADFYGMRKARGKDELGFMTKHDVVISADGSVLSIHSFIRDKSLPKGVVIKLKVHLPADSACLHRVDLGLRVQRCVFCPSEPVMYSGRMNLCS